MSEPYSKFRTRHRFGTKTHKLSRKGGGKFTELDAVMTDVAIVGSQNDVANETGTDTATSVTVPANATALESTAKDTRLCPELAATPESVVVAATPAMSASKRKLTLFSCEYDTGNINYQI